jgi:hypothetical protein
LRKLLLCLCWVMAHHLQRISRMKSEEKEEVGVGGEIFFFFFFYFF